MERATKERFTFQSGGETLGSSHLRTHVDLPDRKVLPILG